MLQRKEFSSCSLPISPFLPWLTLSPPLLRTVLLKLFLLCRITKFNMINVFHQHTECTTGSSKNSFDPTPNYHIFFFIPRRISQNFLIFSDLCFSPLYIFSLYSISVGLSSFFSTERLLFNSAYFCFYLFPFYILF